MAHFRHGRTGQRQDPALRIGSGRFGPAGGVDVLPVPGRSGSLMLCGFSVVGPDPAAVLDELGATTLVCLIEHFEIDQRFPSFARWLAAPSPHVALHVPIVDRSVADDDAMLDLVGRVDALLADGDGVVVHCGAGWGRAGTLAVCVLMANGVAPPDALTAVAAERPGAGPESADQLALVARLAPALGHPTTELPVTSVAPAADDGGGTATTTVARRRVRDAGGMTGVDAAIAGTARAVLEIGRAWITAPSTAARGDELGLDGFFGFWVNGRAGVLGDAHSDVAAAAIGFMAPRRVAELWDGRPSSLSAHECAVAYAEVAADWGRRTFTDVPVDRLAALDQLADRVCAAADASTGVLFAGWRALERPTDPAGRVAVTLNVLREMRGGAHLSAVRAAGLTPLGAIVSTDDPVRGGRAGAERFGWTDPLPPADAGARAGAEAITDTICAPAFAVLADGERYALVDLVAEARAAIGD